MNNQLSTFCFNSNTVRAITINDAPWFVASDVIAVLTLDRKALERLDDDEKGVSSIHTLGGSQQMTIINESGLYSLILGSRKPEAKKFKKWVTAEVLPAIRKNGKYETAPAVTNGETVTRSLASLDALRFQRAITMAIENGERIASSVPMSPEKKLAVVIDLVNDAAGRSVLSKESTGFASNYQHVKAIEGMSDNELARLDRDTLLEFCRALSGFAFDATQAALLAESLSDRLLVIRRAA